MAADDARDTAWVTVYEASTDYAADLVRERLLDAGIPAVVLAHRDHAFHLTVGSMAAVAVRVPATLEAEAAALLATPALGEAELTRIALAAAPVPGMPPARSEAGPEDSGPDLRQTGHRGSD